jgi:hypothetical protein
MIWTLAPFVEGIGAIILSWDWAAAVPTDRNKNNIQKQDRDMRNNPIEN